MPVLKMKRAEKTGLDAIAITLREWIVPLMEIVERKPDTPIQKHLETAFDDLGPSLFPYPRFLLDAREVAVSGPEVAAEAFATAAAAGMTFTPVTGVSRDTDVAAALTHSAHGIALRLTRAEFEAGLLPARLMAFIEEHGLSASEVDLVLDLGAVDDLITKGVVNLTTQFLAAVPHHEQWRSLTVTACAFPRSMGVVDTDSYRLVERSEWRAWRHHLYPFRESLQRLPTYGDCAIQYPLGVEGFDFRTMQVSAAVRYCLAEDWLLIKGRGTRVLRPSIQFPMLAQRLVTGELSSHFAGGGHCAGCAGISAAANGAPRLGSAEVWRRLGTIHHITTVVEALTSLPGL